MYPMNPQMTPQGVMNPGVGMPPQMPPQMMPGPMAQSPGPMGPQMMGQAMAMQPSVPPSAQAQSPERMAAMVQALRGR